MKAKPKVETKAKLKVEADEFRGARAQIRAKMLNLNDGVLDWEGLSSANVRVGGWCEGKGKSGDNGKAEGGGRGEGQ